MIEILENKKGNEGGVFTLLLCIRRAEAESKVKCTKEVSVDLRADFGTTASLA
jgi:hypothetical protein